MESAQYRRLESLRLEISSHFIARYDVAADLKSLIRVREAGAPEAAIFYCARLLEVLSARAIESIGLTASNFVLANLETLRQFSLFPLATRYWAHALRRLGNDVRHVVRPVSESDADLAMMLCERWLNWFFREFSCGPKLSGLTVDGAELFIVVNRPLLGAVEKCDQPAVGVADLCGDLSATAPVVFSTPALSAVIAEMLIERQEHEAAGRVLGEAIKRFGADVRLRQLDGLLLSRMGKLEEAITVLEPLYRRYRDDLETTGILGGVYKRVAERSSSAESWLRKSFDVYDAGWRGLHRSSAYLGINAATLLLLLGEAEESRVVAGEVRALIEERLKLLSKHIADPVSRMSFWDRVILAEAELLLGHISPARDRYRAAFADYARERGDIEVAKAQGTKILAASRTANPESFWD